jgi:hypothetical protein
MDGPFIEVLRDAILGILEMLGRSDADLKLKLKLTS